MRISFIHMQEDHLPLIRQWLKKPHVAEFWQEPEDEQEFRHKYLVKLKEHGISSFIIHADDIPIGYIQSYEAKTVGGGWWPDAEAGTFGLDQFIGNPDYVNKGIGTKIIKLYVDRLFENPDVKKVMADPEPKNIRAIRAYEKAGFKQTGLTRTPGGEAMIVIRTR